MGTKIVRVKWDRWLPLHGTAQSLTWHTSFEYIAIDNSVLPVIEIPVTRLGGDEVMAKHIDAPAEWRRALTGPALGLLLFETLSGLAIYLLPFSELNQFNVLIHTAIGILMIAPVGWYLWRHWRQRYRGNLNHFQLLGYISAAALLTLVVSGLVLTWQALFATRISYMWDYVHIVTTFVFAAGLATHLLLLVIRKSNNPNVRAALHSAYAKCLQRTAIWCGVPVIVCVALALRYQPVTFDESFPESYRLTYGDDRPFAPSLARKDMIPVVGRFKNRVASILNIGEDSEIILKIAPDPINHVGVVGVTERLCKDLDLSPDQRTRLDGAFAETRDAFRRQGRIDARQLAGSAGCGTSGCHSEIVDEWAPSAHRYSSMDFVFQEVQVNMAEELAPEATRYCAGCHDPIALFSGAKNVGNETLSAEGADEGTSCLVCHSMVQTDIRGNADYTIEPPPRYIYELKDGGVAKLLSDFLIRAYPRQHIDSYARPLYKTAEVCGACHKQYIDEELNEAGWVQGQNQYDSWRKSRWHEPGDATRTVGCRECHMPLVDSNDPAAGDTGDFNRSTNDKKHRSHRFLAANQFVPRHHDLPGAAEHCDLTVQWLRGEYEIPEIADRWTKGPVIRLDLNTPETVRPGESVRIQTILTNNKTGHDFPTGPLDMIEAWVEVSVTDEHERLVYASAQPDERDYLVDPKIVFKAEPIDKSGNLIGKHELWNKVGTRYKRSMFPGFADTSEFVFACPAMPSSPEFRPDLKDEEREFSVPHEYMGTELRVTARLWYCKFSPQFLDRLFGADANMRSEVTEMSSAESVIRVDHSTGRSATDAASSAG